jgi:serine/threonine-protein kinase
VPITDPFGLVGQVLDGHFRVDRYVGEGGFSIVYKGTHVGLSEPIAIKCLKLPNTLGSALVESFVKRFRDESRIHYKLSQGNLHVVRSIASGTTIAPTTSALVPYTVLEWLEGRSLADEFADRRAQGLHGRPLVEVVRLLDTAVDALAYAHAQGVVHRDLNPGNLFLADTPSGTKLKVLDFGVAKILVDSAIAMGPSARTMGNLRMFAPAYGAPEQFDERVGPIGPWTDVYALGLLTLEALSDRTVMQGEHIGEFAMKALDETLRPTPRTLGIPVGDEVEQVLARAVAIAPSSRPRDAGELWGMLKHALRVDRDSGQTPHAHPPQRFSSQPPPPTMRMDEAVPDRSGSAIPAIELARPRAAHPMGGTLRIARGSQSATEALAATPYHGPSAAPLASSPSAPPAAASLVSTPITASAPLPRSRAPAIVVALLALVVVAALAAGVWLLRARSRHLHGSASRDVTLAQEVGGAW